MHRISDRPSKADLNHISSSDQETNIDDCIRNIQDNIQLLYQTEPRDDFHLGSYGVNANSYFGTLMPQSSNQKMKHSGFTNDFPQDNHNYYSDNEQQKSNINTDDHIEPYTNRIFEKLTKENQDLLNKKIKLEAQYDLLQSKMTNLEFGFNEKDQIIVQLQDQLRTEKNKYADRDDKLSFSFNKVEILKQQIESQNLKIRELESNELKYQQSLSTIQQQNERFKQMIEDLQNEINRRVKQKVNDNSQNDQELQKLVVLIRDVMKTVGTFVEKYNDQVEQAGAQIKQSNELKRVLYSFGETNRATQQVNSAVEDIERLSILIISLFEQLQIAFGVISSDSKKKQQLQQQIISLEEMSVSLEKQLVQYESQYNELEKYFKISDQQTQKEKIELVETMMKQVQDENSSRNLGRVIQNLEDLNFQLQGDLQRMQEENEYKQDELVKSRQCIIDEQNRAQYQEYRVKKLYHDHLFLKDLLQKFLLVIFNFVRVCSLLQNEDVNMIVEAMLEIQREIAVMNKDQMEIKSQLETQENCLKQQIQEGQLSTKEMMEKRREVELLRGALRNCEEKSRMESEKISQLSQKLENSLIVEKNEKMAGVSYFHTNENNKNFSNNIMNKSRNKIQEKLLGFKIF